MPDLPDDILLTAFALGEVEDPADLERAERLAATDPRAVADVRATAMALEDALAAEPDIGLTAIQYAGIERRLAADAAVDAPHAAGPIPLRRNWQLWGSVAASTLIVATVMAGVMPMVYRAGTRSGAAGRTGEREGGAPLPPDTGVSLVPGVTSDPSAGGPDGLPPLPLVSPTGEPREWPTLRTSIGGLPWPTAAAANTGLREPAFVVANDFPLAVIPVAKASSDASVAGTIAAARAALDAGRLPSPQAIRTDEWVNALRYDDAPVVEEPVSVAVESAVCPWNSGHLLVRVVVRTTGKAGPAEKVVAGEKAEPATSPSVMPLVRDLRLVVEANPAAVAGYKAVGYEGAPRSWGEWADRDEGDVLGPGRTFTVLVEVVPSGKSMPTPDVTPTTRKYRRSDPPVVSSSDLLTVGVEYRQGPAATPRRAEVPVLAEAKSIELASADFRAAAGAAALGLALRHAEPAAQPALAVAVKLLSDVAATAPADDRQAMLDVARRVSTTGK